MGSIRRDLQYGFRMLGRQPMLAATAILAFALGIGLTTTMYSIVNGGLRDLPFPESDRLLHLESNNLSEGIESMEATMHDFLDWRERQTTFEALAAFDEGTANIAGSEGRPERYNGAFMTANAFDLLRVEPLLGRTFAPGEDRPGAEPVLVLGYHVWQARFGGDPGILGRTVRLNSRSHTVIGVMPEGFRFPVLHDLWTPLELDPLAVERGQGATLEVFGRLAPGRTLKEARTELAAIAAQLAAEHPESNEGVGSVVKPYTHEFIGEEAVSTLYVMLAAVFGVLLIACANVANLLLARTAMRSKEVAVRSALGASRLQVVRQLLTETLLLAGAGAVGGLAVAVIGVRLFNHGLAGTEPPYWIDVRIDPAVLLFTLGLTLLAALLSGLLPALQASGSRVGEVLKDESRGSSSFRMGRFSRALVIAEVALSCGLLVGAGLMIKSIIQLGNNDFGINSEGVFTARLGLFEEDYPEVADRGRFFAALLDEAAATPGVAAAAMATSLPVLGSWRMQLAIEGEERAEDRLPRARYAVVSPAFFEVLEVPTLAGRVFSDADRADTVMVALVNSSFAARFFPGESAVGRRLEVRDEGGEEPVWRTIVGVVPDLYMAGTDNEDPEGIYVPLAQADVRFVTLLARSAGGDPMALAGPLRARVERLDPDLPLYWLRSMREAIAQETWYIGVFGSLFAVFGVAALFLASVGLYAVMAFAVSRRTHEVGIRLALGARGGQVLGLIFRQGAVQLATGIAFGLVLAAALSRGLAVLLFQVEPWDPGVFAGIVLVLALCGLAASLIPARRAAAVDPLVALRTE